MAALPPYLLGDEPAENPQASRVMAVHFDRIAQTETGLKLD
jgi:hypothetical protein